MTPPDRKSSEEVDDNQNQNQSQNNDDDQAVEANQLNQQPEEPQQQPEQPQPEPGQQGEQRPRRRRQRIPELSQQEIINRLMNNIDFDAEQIPRVLLNEDEDLMESMFDELIPSFDICNSLMNACDIRMDRLQREMQELLQQMFEERILR